MTAKCKWQTTTHIAAAFFAVDTASDLRLHSAEAGYNSAFREAIAEGFSSGDAKAYATDEFDRIMKEPGL